MPKLRDNTAPPLTKAQAKVNKLRRKKYAEDTAYADSVRERFRNFYRERNKVQLTRNCAENLPLLRGQGIKRLVKCADGERREFKCYGLKQLCEALGGYFIDNVRDWICRGMFPGPVHSSTVDGTGKSKMGIYTFNEMKALLTVFSEQQQTKAYYTKADKGTQRALFSAVERARRTDGYGTKKQG